MADETPELPPVKPPKRGWASAPDLGALEERAPWWVKLLIVIVASVISGASTASYRMDELEDDVDELTEAVILMRIEVAANHGKP